jgi:hypothetical protein
MGNLDASSGVEVDVGNEVVGISLLPVSRLAALARNLAVSQYRENYSTQERN